MIAGAPTFFSPSMHAEKAPTPGTTRPAASRATLGSDVTTTVNPDVSKALAADRRLPEP
jgi:hypothetical protein